MTPTPHPTEIRTMLEKAAKLMGYTFQFRQGLPCIYEQPTHTNTHLSALGWSVWKPNTSAHDSRMLAIQAGIEVRHFKTHVNAEIYIGAFAYIDFPPNPTTADKLQCELLAVLKCAAAIQDEREKL